MKTVQMFLLRHPRCALLFVWLGLLPLLLAQVLVDCLLSLIDGARDSWARNRYEFYLYRAVIRSRIKNSGKPGNTDP